MVLTEQFLPLLHVHAQWLVAALGVGFFVGEFVARFAGVDFFAVRGAALVAALGRKLDRPQRDVATLVYRGIIALALLMLPMVAIGVGLNPQNSTTQLIDGVLLVALFGRAFRTVALAQMLRAKALHLEIPEVDFLFADSHARWRYSIIQSAEDFAVGVVGASFWYLVFGMPALLAYLALATAHDTYHSRAFGWAARMLFKLADAPPRVLTLALLAVAGLFVPRAQPFSTWRARNFYGFVAQLLGVSLGGLLPGRELPWAGEGTAKLEGAHLLRWLLLRLVASILLGLMFAAPILVNLLKTYYK